MKINGFDKEVTVKKPNPPICYCLDYASATVKV